MSNVRVSTPMSLQRLKEMAEDRRSWGQQDLADSWERVMSVVINQGPLSQDDFYKLIAAEHARFDGDFALSSSARQALKDAVRTACLLTVTFTPDTTKPSDAQGSAADESIAADVTGNE